MTVTNVRGAKRAGALSDTQLANRARSFLNLKAQIEELEATKAELQAAMITELDRRKTETVTVGSFEINR